MPSRNFASPPSHSAQTILPNGVNSSTSSLDISRSEVYQVDYTCVNAGKTVGATKRRIRWRFGFADPEAIERGLTGPECRGEEHEIIFNWSLTSGKQVVLADGNEVFVECRPYETQFQFSWTMRGNHQVKITGSIKPSFDSKSKSKSKQRQFNMFLDGKSFFDFSQIYELGKTATRSTKRSTESVSSNNYNRNKNRIQVLPEPESEQVEWPKEKSFVVPVTPNTVATSQSYNDMHFNFRSDSASSLSVPAATASYNSNSNNNYNNNNVNEDFLSAPPPPTLDQVNQAYSNPISYAPVQAHHDHVHHVQNVQNVYSVSAEHEQQYQQYRHHRMSQQVMEAYQQVNANVNTPPALTLEPYSIKQESNESAPAPAPTLTFEGDETYIAPRMTQEEEEPCQDGISQMMKKLCNLDDITSDPQLESKLTMRSSSDMNNNKKHKDAKKKQPKNKSVPIQPKEIHYTGAKPSLNDIKKITHSTCPPPSTSPKEVMKKPTFVPNHGHDVHAGALVVHGQQSGNWSQAPPLQKPVGFGVGSQLRQGYGQYTQHVHVQQPQSVSVYANQ